MPLDQNSTDLPITPSSEIPHSSGKTDKIKNVNFFLPQSGDDVIAFSGAPQGCVFTFGHDYEFRNNSFEPQPKVPDALRKDTTNLPDPPSGWFGLPPYLFYYLAQHQTFPWAFVRDADGFDSGTKGKLDPVLTPNQFYPDNVTQPQSQGIIYKQMLVNVRAFNYNIHFYFITIQDYLVRLKQIISEILH